MNIHPGSFVIGVWTTIIVYYLGKVSCEIYFIIKDWKRRNRFNEP